MKHRDPTDIEERLVQYERLLHAWSQRLDLISPGDRERIRERHIDDSLRALAAITAAPAGPCIDVGSGAGLPGIPLAIASGRVWRLLEPRRRRAAFLEEVVRELGLEGCQVFPLTAQQAAATPELAHDHVIATARALAAPAVAADLCRPLVRPDGATLLFVGVGAENPPNSAEIVPGLITIREDGNQPG